jgi:hypothetical protein
MTQPFVSRKLPQALVATLWAPALLAFASVALAQTPTPVPLPDGAAAAFARADTNGDGKLSKEEATRFPAIADKFEALDKDGDGMLTLAEFAVAFETPK